MSARKCAREECGKTVYPLEELKCLDKVWHKMCFKCTICGTTLNLKSYKGYDKMPYCEPHYPKTVPTAVTDTPDMKRLAENTKNQSLVAYHAQYEKMKGMKTEIADDPEISRHLKNTQVQSQLKYTGELDKKKHQEDARPNHMASIDAGVPPAVSQNPPPSAAAASARAVGSIADYDPLNGQWGAAANSQAAAKIRGLRHDDPASRYCRDFAEEAARGGATVNQSTRTVQSATTAKTNGAVPAASVGFAVKAIYDYTAADKDEVSFLEGDIIVNCQKVDEGWMTGTVQRTLQWGMLPANYVEAYKLPTGLHRIK